MATSNPVSAEALESLDNIFKMLSCVKCEALPKYELHTLGRCEHKYCEACVAHVAGNGCTVCGQISAAKEAGPDEFTTRLLVELRIVEGVMKRRNDQEALPNNSPSLIHDDEQENTLGRKASLQKELDYSTKSRLSPKKEEKKRPAGEKAVVQSEQGTSEEEEELLSLEVKHKSPASKKGFKKSLNSSKFKRQIVSSDDENENDDFKASKDKTIQRTSSVPVPSPPSVKVNEPVISSIKGTKGRKEKGGINKTFKTPIPDKSKKDTNKTMLSNKTLNDAEINSEIYLFDESNDEGEKEKVESPPCLTPYVKLTKTSNEVLGKRALKSSDKRKRVETPVLTKGKKLKTNSFDKTTKTVDMDESVENTGAKYGQDKNGDRSPQSPPSLTPYGKVNSSKAEATTSLRKSKRVSTLSKSETPKSKEEGYSETPKPDKKKKPKTLLNPLKANNPKTPDENDRSKSPNKPQGQTETTMVKEAVRQRKRSSAVSVASSSPSLASTSFSSGSGAAVDKRNAKGETHLHIACRAGHLEKVKQLIEAGADINAQDHAGWTPLHEALNEKSSCRFEIVSLLCQQGCNTNIPGMDDESALHEASRAGYVEIVKLLLSHSASPNLRNSARKLPRDVATKEQIKTLLDKAAGYNSEKDDPMNSPSVDDPVVLEIEFSKALIYFNYNIPPKTLKAIETNLKLKVSKTLRDGVTHIVFPVDEEDLGKVKVQFSYEYLFGVVNGVWMLSTNWIEESLCAQRLLPPKPYEILGCVGINKEHADAPTKARVNKEVGNPGLLNGMSFYLYKNCSFEKISKKELTTLIKNAGGDVINREPNPESVDPFETPVRFHATEPNHKLVLTSHVILYNDNNEPPKEKKYNMEHLKVLNVKWLIDSIESFFLLNPEDYL